MESELDKENASIINTMIQLYSEVQSIYGYRRMKLNINRLLKKKYNHKRIYRLMKSINMKSVICRKKKNYVPNTPQVTAENILKREFYVDKPNQKWLTDVTEFKLTDEIKAYLSSILDLHDNSIVSYVLGRSNSNILAFQTFDKPIEANSNASPLFHSDRDFQYICKSFKKKLDDIGAIQSMSRVSRCIDNGPMEELSRIIKAEIYYLTKFHHFHELQQSIDKYIDFYNTRRLQEKLKGLTPIGYQNQTIVY